VNLKKRFDRWFKLRFAIIYPFGVIVIFFHSPSEAYFKIGLPIIIVGLLIRAWANGYAIKMEKLTTSGPYAYLRHPLYLGTMLIIIGFVIMLRVFFIGGALFVVMVAVYSKTIKKEEKMLEAKFKDIYIDYKKKVPAIFPTIFPYLQGEKWSFSFKRLVCNKEYKLFFWILILVVVFYLKEELVVEKEGMNIKIWSFIVVVFLLGLTDLVTEIMNRRKKDRRMLSV
jgi:protein-S-isoprenylcysteine O-methyltransferase Ste14